MTTKVIPINYTDDIEKLQMKDGGTTQIVGIENMSITYVQPADTCSDRDESQTLTITTQYAESCSIEEAEKQEGCYFDITIPEGQHWSVNDGDELKALVDDFKKRLYMTTEHNKPKEKK